MAHGGEYPGSPAIPHPGGLPGPAMGCVGKPGPCEGYGGCDGAAGAPKGVIRARKASAMWFAPGIGGSRCVAALGRAVAVLVVTMRSSAAFGQREARRALGSSWRAEVGGNWMCKSRGMMRRVGVWRKRSGLR